MDKRLVFATVLLVLALANTGFPNSDDMCDQFVNYTICEEGDSLRPSWCVHRNPFVIPRLLTSAVEKAPTRTAYLRCEQGQCGMFSQFSGTMIRDQTGNVTRFFVILLNQNATANQIVFLDEELNFQPGLTIDIGFEFSDFKFEPQTYQKNLSDLRYGWIGNSQKTIDGYSYQAIFLVDKGIITENYPLGPHVGLGEQRSNTRVTEAGWWVWDDEWVWMTLSKNPEFSVYRLWFTRPGPGQDMEYWEIDREPVMSTDKCLPFSNAFADFQANCASISSSGTCSVQCNASMAKYMVDRQCQKFYYDSVIASYPDDSIGSTQWGYINLIQACQYGHVARNYPFLPLNVSVFTHKYECTVESCPSQNGENLFDGESPQAVCDRQRSMIALITEASINVFEFTRSTGSLSPLLPLTTDNCPVPCVEAHYNSTINYVTLVNRTTKINLEIPSNTTLYSVPPDYRIVSASVFAMQTVPYLRQYDPAATHVAQQVWATVAIRNMSTKLDSIKVMEFAEFGQMTANNTAFTDMFHPVGPLNSLCDNSSLYYSVLGCVLKPQADLEILPAGTQVTGLTYSWLRAQKEVVDKMKETNCSCNSGDVTCLSKKLANSDDTNGIDAIRSVQSSPEGQIHVLLATTNDRRIFAMYLHETPDECSSSMQAKYGESSALLQSDNRVLLVGNTIGEVALVGSAQFLQLTDNAQSAIFTVTRQKTELDAMTGATEICELMAMGNNSNDERFAAFKETCQAGPLYPRRPSLVDFIQFATMCIPGSYCPDFAIQTISAVADGFWSEFGFDQKPCTNGSFCANGVRQDCPIGFVCPIMQMARPQRCGIDVSGNTNCFATGLTAPQICANGTFCFTPYLPALPAPPGFKQGFDDASPPRRVSLGCNISEYCGIGRAVAEGNDLLCPEGTYCPNVSVLVPLYCHTPDEICFAQNCPTKPQGCVEVCGGMGSCPQGSVNNSLCQAGRTCATPLGLGNVCQQGHFCPAGTFISTPCPGGFYCPSPAYKTPCPAGYYCPEGSYSPLPCSALDFCREGTDVKQNGLLGLVFIFIVPCILWLLARLGLRERDRRRALRQQGYEKMGHTGAGVSIKKEPMEMSQVHSPVSLSTAENMVSLESSVSVSFNDQTASSDDMPRSRRERKNISEAERSKTAANIFGSRKFFIDFKFDQLGLKLKGSGRSVLSGVTGEIRSSRITAVMGPSGAGKSTFLTTLAGKSYYGDQTGHIYINGKECNLSVYKNLVGFVPQEDIMMRDLSVKENIWLSALLRLPANWTLERKRQFRDSTMHVLGLWEIRHSIIGDEHKRGISGGQRKRVNIALEMVTDPTVLFLDEPTSGLDSTSSMEVCGALRKIADLGLTIALVLHQPRYEIFCAFHDVLLLGKGGRTVYLGPSSNAITYFQAHGLECPLRVNPPDFFMDVIAGDVPMEFKMAHPEFRPPILFEYWDKHLEEKKNDIVDEVHYPSAAVEQAAIDRTQPNIFYFLFRFMVRCFVQQSRSPTDIFIDNVLVFLAAGFMSFINVSEPWVTLPPALPAPCYEGNQVGNALTPCGTFATHGVEAIFGGQNNILIRGQMTVMAIGLTACASSIRVFGRERVVYWREAAGLSQPKHTIAYFLGKDLAMLPQMFLGPLIYAAMFIAISAARGQFAGLYAVLFGLTFTAYSFGYLVSIVSPISMAQLVGVVVIFSFAAIDGAQPTIPKLKDSIWPLTWAPYRLSFLSYGLEAFYINEATAWIDSARTAGVDLVAVTENTFDFTLTQFYFSNRVGILFAFGFAVRAFTILIMYLKDKEKKL